MILIITSLPISLTMRLNGFAPSNRSPQISPSLLTLLQAQPMHPTMHRRNGLRNTRVSLIKVGTNYALIFLSVSLNWESFLRTLNSLPVLRKFPLGIPSHLRSRKFTRTNLKYLQVSSAIPMLKLVVSLMRSRS